jgi:hypothetical protein
MSNISGRIFTTSLKPAKTPDEIKEFVSRLTGTATIFAITHDKDSDSNTGEIVDSHTHYLIEYDTPRKITTIANLFGVESNFVEVVKSKKAMLRYLTHMDDSEKYQYSPDEVITNSPIPYSDVVLGQNMSDKEIAKYIAEGRGSELLGMVSASKLRTIQSFISYERDGLVFKELRKMNDKIDNMTDSLHKIKEIAEDFQLGVASAGKALIPKIQELTDSIILISKKGLK